MTYDSDRQSFEAMHWHDSALGQNLVRSGIEIMQKLLPRQYFRVTLLIAGSPHAGYLDIVESDVRYRLGKPSHAGNSVDVIGVAEWLPFAANSIDLLILPHVLEFCEEPHDVLREVSQCIVSEGIVVIAGLNPNSMLGLKNKVPGMKFPSEGETKMYSVLRVRDWMSLLGFDAIAGSYGFHRPPFEQASKLARFEKFEIAGARWWPGLGSVYVLVFRKKDLGVRMQGRVLSGALGKNRRVLRPVTEYAGSSDGRNQLTNRLGA